MTLRRILFALILATVTSTANAGPPESRLPQGRELDPVTRDYYLPLSLNVFPAPPASDSTPVPTGTAFSAALFDSLWEAILNEFTIPLGTVEPANFDV